MAIFWGGIGKGLLQVKLACAGVQNIRASNNMGNSLFGIIYHHRELVGVQGVLTLNDKVRGIATQGYMLLALPDIVKSQTCPPGAGLLHVAVASSGLCNFRQDPGGFVCNHNEITGPVHGVGSRRVRRPHCAVPAT
jgi:hypothetical protein